MTLVIIIFESASCTWNMYAFVLFLRFVLFMRGKLQILKRILTDSTLHVRHCALVKCVCALRIYFSSDLRANGMGIPDNRNGWPVCLMCQPEVASVS